MGEIDRSERDQITFKSVIVICFLSFLFIYLFVDNFKLFGVNVSASLHVVCILWGHI